MIKAATLAGLVAFASSIRAQDDRIVLAAGEAIAGVRVLAFDVSQVRYQREGNTLTVSADRVDRVEPGKAAEVFGSGLAARNPIAVRDAARAQLAAKNVLLAQIGYVAAGRLWIDRCTEADIGLGFDCLDELAREVPQAGVLPAAFRIKFVACRGRGDARGAQVVARKYLATATAGGFAPGLLLEAEFMALAADAMAGTVNASSYRNRLLVLRGKVDAAQSMLSDAIDVELAASLHESGDKDGARRLLETVLARERVDVNARAAAWLEHGRILMAAGSATDRTAYRSAMLDFLHVRLETRDCWRNLQAEALLQAGIAAQKWQGEDWRFIQGRCRAILLDEFGGTEWAKKVQAR